MTPSPLAGVREEELGIFNTVHFPHTHHAPLAGVREEEQCKDDQKLYNVYYDQMMWIYNTLMDDINS